MSVTVVEIEFLDTGPCLLVRSAAKTSEYCRHLDCLLSNIVFVIHRRQKYRSCLCFYLIILKFLSRDICRWPLYLLSDLKQRHYEGHGFLFFLLFILSHMFFKFRLSNLISKFLATIRRGLKWSSSVWLSGALNVNHSNFRINLWFLKRVNIDTCKS